jgi:hypothetical protein
MTEDDMSYCSEITTAMETVSTLRTRARNSERQLRGELHITEKRECDLRRRAALRFAEINGWKYSTKEFAPAVLARGGAYRRKDEAWYAGWVHDLFDHPVYFREARPPYRPVAIVGQPYNTDVASARIVAARIGLDLHAPPSSTASWWLPGETAFFCCTRPGMTVAFLPEQS